MKIFLDIETIPLGEEPVYEYEPFAGVNAPANYKDPAKIAEYIKDNETRLHIEHLERQKTQAKEQLNDWKKGALKATKSQIVCICAISETGHYFQMSDPKEFDLLLKFGLWCSSLDSTHYVGHNVENFDIPMIRTHAIKWDLVKLKQRFTFKKFSENILDTMTIWDKKNWTKLTEIAEFLGIKDLNEGTTGADIYDLYKAGKFKEIETKCMNDTLMCKEVYGRIC
jgi:predicted PolB exonuclease-like 3'-5' exonuclease